MKLAEQELMHLKWSDVSMKEKTLTVRSAPELKFWVKDKEERVIPIPVELVSQLDAYRKAHPKAVLVTGTANDKTEYQTLADPQAISESGWVAVRDV